MTTYRLLQKALPRIWTTRQLSTPSLRNARIEHMGIGGESPDGKPIYVPLSVTSEWHTEESSIKLAALADREVRRARRAAIKEARS